MGSPSRPLSLPSHPACLPIRALGSPQRFLACRQLELFCLNWFRKESFKPSGTWEEGSPRLLPLLSWTCLRPSAPSRLACRQCPERESSKPCSRPAVLWEMGSGGNQHKEQRRLVLCAEHCHVPAWHCAVGTLATVVWAGGKMCQGHVGTEDKSETRGCPGYPPSPLMVFPTHVPGCQMEVKPGNPKTGIELSPSVLLPAFSNMTHLTRGPTPSISATKKSQAPWHLSSLLLWICP